MKKHPIYVAAAAAWAKKPGSSVYISTTDTAKLIRVVLKEKFPRTKFSVVSNKYAGGSSIDVRWMDGPTTKLVEGYVNAFAGAGFDGMIDMKYHSDSWLYPNGMSTFMSTSGTEGSRGVVAAADYAPAADGAIPVSFSADYVFCRREPSAEALRRTLTAHAAKRGDQLAEAIRAGKVQVVEDKWGARIENAHLFKSESPVGYTYGAQSALYNMAQSRMLAAA